MTITLRLTKGAPLTHEELDGNFSDLDARFPVQTANIGDLQVTSGKLATDAVLTAKVADANITFAKIQDASGASKLLGRGDSGGGDFQEITLGAGLTMSGTELSASGAGLPAADTTAVVQGSADSTKRLRFEVDGFTASTTRVITPADRDWSPTVFGEELAEVADAAAGRTKLALGSFATLSSLAIDGLSDVAISAPANNEVLAFDTASGQWINQTPTEAGLSAALTLSGTFTQRASGDISLAGGSDGDVLTVQADGSVAFEVLGAHEHSLADITNAGGLAALDTVDGGSINAQAVTLDKIVDQAGFTAGSFTNPTIEVSQEGIITNIESGFLAELATVNDTNTAITIGDAVTNTHRRLTSDSAITLTLDAQATVGARIAVTPKGGGAVTAQVEAGATYEMPGDNDAARTTSFGVTGYCLFECVANSGGSAAVWDVVGETNHSDLADNALDMNGQQITNAVMPLEDDEETASFTFALVHGQQEMVRCNHATVAITATVPANATVAFPVGSVLTLNQWGAAAVTVAAAGGVTINKPSDKTLVLRGQYSVVSLWKQATDTWLAFGDLTDV